MKRKAEEGRGPQLMLDGSLPRLADQRPALRRLLSVSGQHPAPRRSATYAPYLHFEADAIGIGVSYVNPVVLPAAFTEPLTRTRTRSQISQ